jgi:hypothetical protein
MTTTPSITHSKRAMKWPILSPQKRAIATCPGLLICREENSYMARETLLGALGTKLPHPAVCGVGKLAGMTPVDLAFAKQRP